MIYHIYLVIDPSNGEIVKAFLAKEPAMTFADDKYSVQDIAIPMEFLLQ